MIEEKKVSLSSEESMKVMVVTLHPPGTIEINFLPVSQMGSRLWPKIAAKKSISTAEKVNLMYNLI